MQEQNLLLSNASNLKPILFSTPMVQAILRGEKTQTRRIIKSDEISESINLARCKYKVGDTLWIREEHYRFGKWIKNGFTKLGNQKWKFIASTDDIRYFDNPPEEFKISRDKKNPESPFWYKRLARFMPRKYYRIFLNITNIRIERLNDITENDAIAEGIERFEGNITQFSYKDYLRKHILLNSPIDSYQTLWQKINGEKSWEKNPWVWVYSFEKIK